MLELIKYLIDIGYIKITRESEQFNVFRSDDNYICLVIIKERSEVKIWCDSFVYCLEENIEEYLQL